MILFAELSFAGGVGRNIACMHTYPVYMGMLASAYMHAWMHTDVNTCIHTVFMYIYTHTPCVPTYIHTTTLSLSFSFSFFSLSFSPLPTCTHPIVDMIAPALYLLAALNLTQNFQRWCLLKIKTSCQLTCICRSVHQLHLAPMWTQYNVYVRNLSICKFFQEYEEPVYSYSTYPGRR